MIVRAGHWIVLAPEDGSSTHGRLHGSAPTVEAARDTAHACGLCFAVIVRIEQTIELWWANERGAE